MVDIGEKKIPWRDGLTVAQLIQEMDDPYDYVAVRLNGRIVSEPHFPTTLVPEGARVSFIPMIAGG